MDRILTRGLAVPVAAVVDRRLPFAGGSVAPNLNGMTEDFAATSIRHLGMVVSAGHDNDCRTPGDVESQDPLVVTVPARRGPG
ncbi:hypothetical protein [Actinoplanes subtropicus]|uniref:hypothetical protein n=1 Tax=Actinoplanes subtropicus TaxID=543632 RepID=UPI0004C3FCDF|nr:hypothetical protein [Actinoplanes subtropicus]